MGLWNFRQQKIILENEGEMLLFITLILISLYGERSYVPAIYPTPQKSVIEEVH
jgi:hypothetical protein